MKHDEPAVYAIIDGFGRRYIGSSVLPARRWRQHQCELRKNRHHSPALQAVANKYGLSSLRFEVLVNVPVEQLQAMEQALLDQRPELNCIYEAGPGRMHRDSTYLSNLRAALHLANERPEYREARRRANPQKRSVICANDGIQFESCSAAARHYGVTSGSVSASATGLTHKTEGGLRFHFADGSSVKRPWIDQRRRITNSAGEKFDSVSSASRMLGVTRAAIHYAIRNRTRSGGFHWNEA